MAAETQDRWTEIRKLHVDWKDAYRILGGVVLVGIGVVIGAGWFANPQADSYTTNLYTEFISIAITVFILDFLNRRRDDRRRIEDLKAQLLRQVRSPEMTVRNQAIHEIRDRRWLTGEDGLLKGANLWKASLQGADLKRVNLQKANLDRANLQGADLTGARLQKATLGETNLYRAQLAYAHLQEAILDIVNLQEADLTGANLRAAEMGEANLHKANLTDTDLQEVYLGEANLQGTQLVNAKLCEADLSDANLRGADLTDADLQGADLRRADMQGTILWGANLQGANLTEVNFDAKTLLSDVKWDAESDDFTTDSYWSPDTDMRRYTDPEHPDFWQPEWVKTQGEGDEG